MVAKSQYQTKQMIEILNYLKKVQGSHVTVNDICNYFSSQGITVGVTTIYRHLERMVKDGSVAKYLIEGTNGACFEYIGDVKEKHTNTCFHCKCEECGRLIHMDCDELSKIESHLKDSHGFAFNARRTVFYGLCKDCLKIN